MRPRPCPKELRQLCPWPVTAVRQRDKTSYVWGIKIELQNPQGFEAGLEGQRWYCDRQRWTLWANRESPGSVGGGAHSECLHVRGFVGDEAAKGPQARPARAPSKELTR